MIEELFGFLLCLSSENVPSARVGAGKKPKSSCLDAFLSLGKVVMVVSEPCLLACGTGLGQGLVTTLV